MWKCQKLQSAEAKRGFWGEAAASQYFEGCPVEDSMLDTECLENSTGAGQSPKMQAGGVHSF